RPRVVRRSMLSGYRSRARASATGFLCCTSSRRQLLARLVGEPAQLDRVALRLLRFPGETGGACRHPLARRRKPPRLPTSLPPPRQRLGGQACEAVHLGVVGPAGIPQPRRVTALEGVVLRVAELVPRRKEALDLGRAGVGQLVQRPGSDGWLAQCLDDGRAF